MSVEDDLPALRTADLDLPRLAVADRRHEPPLARVHPAWSSHAAQIDVRAVACGPGGDVWLATAGGVLRWRPGLERFTRYGSEHGLPGNGIRAVAVARDGTVWALADNGTLARLVGDEWAENGSSGATCLATSSDEDGSVWTVVDGTVLRLDAAHNAVPLAAGPSHVRALAIRAPADLWAAGAEGVFQYEGGGWRRRLRHPAVTGLLRDERGLWVASARGLEFADLDARSLQVPPGVARGPATALALAPGGVWAAVGGGVGRATPDGWAPLPGARRAAVTALAAGPDGQVLIGTREGLLRATEQSEPVPHLSDQAPDVVGRAGEPLGVPSLVQALALQPTAAGATVWLGTTRGLFAFEPALGRWRRVAARRVGDVRALAGGDPLWIGTWRDGLRALVDGRVGGAAAGIGGPITALAPALAGGAWAGGPDGVYRSDPAISIDDGGGWSRVLGPEDLPDGAWVRSLVDSPDGLWIGTSAGLLRLDGAGLDAPVEGLRDADVRALLVAGDDLLAGTARGLYARAAPVAGLEEAEVAALVKWGGAILVGTAEGLYRAEHAAGGWTALRPASSADSGLAADRVTALAAANGQAWIGTTNGLGCLEG
jgi:ligand-binding sensor domain-containing protein